VIESDIQLARSIKGKRNRLEFRLQDSGFNHGLELKAHLPLALLEGSLVELLVKALQLLRTAPDIDSHGIRV
jgi:hypothetical protein